MARFEGKECSTPDCPNESIGVRFPRRADGTLKTKKPVYACPDCLAYTVSEQLEIIGKGKK